MEIKHFTTAQVARMMGFTVRKLDNWARTEFLVPSGYNAKGSGSRRLYNLDDLVHLGFVKRLQSLGWSTQKIRKVLEHLRSLPNDSNQEKPAVSVDKSLILAKFKSPTDELIMVNLISGQQAMSFVWDTMRQETQEMIRKAAIASVYPKRTKQSAKRAV